MKLGELYSFSLDEFSWSFSTKVFNEAIRASQHHMYHVLFLQIFPTGFLWSFDEAWACWVSAQGGVLGNWAHGQESWHIWAPHRGL